VSSDQAVGIGIGLFACLIGVGGVIAALSRHRRRAEIAATYGSTGGVVYTVFQAGCSGILILGGLALIVVALLLKK
jgi:hypothetical protein